ncbi:kunitz-like toxin PcKuz3 [Haemaphysalis longicornis]
MKSIFLIFLLGLSVTVASSRHPGCLQPVAPGPCEAHIPRFYYNANTRRCQPFIYGGCRGNDNRFPDLQTCRRLCQGF